MTYGPDFYELGKNPDYLDRTVVSPPAAPDVVPFVGGLTGQSISERLGSMSVEKLDEQPGELARKHMVTFRGNTVIYDPTNVWDLPADKAALRAMDDPDEERQF